MKILANPDEMHALVETLLAENVRLRADNERMSRELGDFHMQQASRIGLSVDPLCCVHGAFLRSPCDQCDTEATERESIAGDTKAGDQSP